MFAVLVVVLLGIIAAAVAPDIMAALAGIGCFLALVGAAIMAVLIVLILTGVIQ